ncbi:MAG: IPT/TIG domain-containing protein [Planctomycetota bacterium]|nr:IPT/TIG domain-containing protein [Planctomycetota bacterium]
MIGKRMGNMTSRFAWLFVLALATPSCGQLFEVFEWEDDNYYGDTVYDPPPQPAAAIVTVAPQSGRTEGGQIVTIITGNFGDNFTVNLPEVYFGTTSAVVYPVDHDTIRVLTPANPVGTTPLSVMGTANVETAVAPDDFLFTSGPEVLRIFPPAGGSEGGDSVTIATQGYLDDFLFSLPEVYFGNQPAVLTAIDSNTLRVQTPACPAGPADVTVSATVVVEGAVLAGGFTYVAPGSAQIVSLSPDGGEGGRRVTITTTGFQDDFATIAPRVFFRGIEATFVSATTTTIVVIVPYLSQGYVDVRVISAGNSETAVLVRGFYYC